MANTIVDAMNMCRFCLCHEELMPFAQAKSSALTFEDALHFTGIELSENQEFVVCEECCVSINSSANFRRTCLRNDAIFRRLVSFGNRIAQNNFTVKRVVAGQVMRTDQPTDLTAGENEIITLDDSESDDASSQVGKPESAEMNPFPPEEHEETEIEQTSSYDEPDAVALDDDDSDYSITSANGEPTSKALVENNIPQTISESTSVFDKEGTSTQNDDFPADESDSDYSLPSLYSECVNKIERTERPKPIWYTCLICGCKTMDVKRHMQYSHTRRYQCPYCDFQPVNLASHIRYKHKTIAREITKRSKEKLACPHCSKKFLDEESLKSHVDKCPYTRLITETCEECGKGFANKAGYVIHKKHVHGPDSAHKPKSVQQPKSGEFECQACYKKLSSLNAYKEHIKKHSPTATKCEDCGKLFKTMFTFGLHKHRGLCEKQKSNSK